jgi:nucleoside-diphosphate-sugar epimerase
LIRVSVLGCGWLGLPLAQTLLVRGFAVNGSTTTASKLATLEREGINAFTLLLAEEGITGDTSSFLEGSHILIIDIPPKLRKENSESFTDKIATLIPHIEKAGIKKLLFISSTSVYADDNSVVTEDTTPLPDTESGRQLLETEILLQSNALFKTTILRFGGLIGGDRHPVHYLAGKENLENPEGPVNLIHRDDCIGIILKIIAKEAWGDTYNAVAPEHPTREEYYTQKAAALGLELPKFTHEKAATGKTVTPDKLISSLGYTFIASL